MPGLGARVWCLGLRGSHALAAAPGSLGRAAAGRCSGVAVVRGARPGLPCAVCRVPCAACRVRVGAGTP